MRWPFKIAGLLGLAWFVVIAWPILFLLPGWFWIGMAVGVALTFSQLPRLLV